ncbi:MAG: hypothetical protein ACF8XB_17720, partial [Planctomycetota bacterium JB042]
MRAARDGTTDGARLAGTTIAGVRPATAPIGGGLVATRGSAARAATTTAAARLAGTTIAGVRPGTDPIGGASSRLAVRRP